MTRPLQDALSRATADYVSALDELGIEVAQPFGRVTVDPDTGHARIGFVVIWDDGSVVAVPFAGTNTMQIAAVLQHAETALLNGAVGPQWTRVRDLGWETSIYELPSEARA